MKFIKAHVITGLFGPDKIHLETNLPNAFPIYKDEPQTLQFEALQETGVDYVQKNFPDLEIEVVNAKTGEKYKV